MALSSRERIADTIEASVLKLFGSAVDKLFYRY
jgi:hypothetical protein